MISAFYGNEKHEDKAQSRDVPSRAQRGGTTRRKLAARERIPGRGTGDMEKFADLPLHIPPVQLATPMSLP